DLKNRLLEANAVNRSQREIWSEGRRLERESVIADTVANAGRRRPLKMLKRLATDPESPRWIKSLLSLGNRSTIAHLIGGRLGTMLREDVWDGERRVYDLWMRGRDAVKAAVERAGLEWGSEDLRRISSLTFGDKAEVLAIEIDGRTVEATPAEWMTLYALLGDEGHGSHLRHGAPIVFARQRVSGQPIPMGRVNADLVIRQLPDELKRIVDDAKRWYGRNVTPAEAKAFREHFGFAMEKFHGYFRGKRVPADAKAREEMLGQADAGGSAPGHEPRLSGMGAWKLRDEAATKAPYLIGDFFGEFDSMVKESAARIFMNKTVRSLQSLLLDKDQVQPALTKAYGRELLPVLSEMINDSAIVFKRPRIRSRFNRWLSKASRNVARAFLSVAPSPALKNIGGVFKLAAVIEPKYLAPATRETFSGDVYKRLIAASPFLRYRHEQSAALRAYNAIENLESDLLGPPKKRELVKRAAKGQLGRLGELADRSRMMDWADARASVVAFRAYELQAEKEHADWTPRQRLEWAAERAERAVRQTQNPTTTIDRTRIAARHVDDLVSSLLMFRSDSLASLNLLLQGMMTGPKATLRNVAAVSANHAWAAAVSAALRVGPIAAAAAIAGTGDDEKYRKGRRSFWSVFGEEFASNTLGVVPYAPEATEGAVRSVQVVWGTESPTEFRFSPSPVVRALEDGFQGLINVGRGVKSAHDAQTEAEARRAAKLWHGGLYDAAVNGSTLAGLPVQPTAAILRRVYQGATAEIDPKTARDAAAAAVKRGDQAEAARAIAAALRTAAPGELEKTITATRNALFDHGPKGKLTEKEWQAKLKASPADAKRLRKEQADWELSVWRAMREPSAAARKRTREAKGK
ncbi:MAG TPA: hypothetical protein VFF65_01500, partial [Phycisphaerales bacterium]|nr:hypothetical protein [Phycisphaerales bacterium]